MKDKKPKKAKKAKPNDVADLADSILNDTPLEEDNGGETDWQVDIESPTVDAADADEAALEREKDIKHFEETDINVDAINNTLKKHLVVHYQPINVPTRPKVEAPVGPTRTHITKGFNKPNAIIVHSHINEVAAALGEIFGNRDGDYMIGSENMFTSFDINRNRKRYKCVQVIDKNEFSYILWFDVTKLGAIY